jgi:hypothetical protein
VNDAVFDADYESRTDTVCPASVNTQQLVYNQAARSHAMKSVSRNPISDSINSRCPFRIPFHQSKLRCHLSRDQDVQDSTHILDSDGKGLEAFCATPTLSKAWVREDTGGLLTRKQIESRYTGIKARQDDGERSMD